MTKVRVWVDKDGLARIFDTSDWTIRACTPEEAALHATRPRGARTVTRPIEEVVLDELLKASKESVASPPDPVTSDTAVPLEIRDA